MASLVGERSRLGSAARSSSLTRSTYLPAAASTPSVTSQSHYGLGNSSVGNRYGTTSSYGSNGTPLPTRPYHTTASTSSSLTQPTASSSRRTSLTSSSIAAASSHDLPLRANPTFGRSRSKEEEKDGGRPRSSSTSSLALRRGTSPSPSLLKKPETYDYANSPTVAAAMADIQRRTSLSQHPAAPSAASSSAALSYPIRSGGGVVTHTNSSAMSRPGMASASLASRSGAPVKIFAPIPSATMANGTATSSSSTSASSHTTANPDISPSTLRRVSVTRFSTPTTTAEAGVRVARAPSLGLASMPTSLHPNGTESALHQRRESLSNASSTHSLLDSATGAAQQHRSQLSSTSPYTTPTHPTSSSAALQSAYHNSMAQAQAQAQTHSHYVHQPAAAPTLPVNRTTPPYTPTRDLTVPSGHATPMASPSNVTLNFSPYSNAFQSQNVPAAASVASNYSSHSSSTSSTPTGHHRQTSSSSSSISPGTLLNNHPPSSTVTASNRVNSISNHFLPSSSGSTPRASVHIPASVHALATADSRQTAVRPLQIATHHTSVSSAQAMSSNSPSSTSASSASSSHRSPSHQQKRHPASFGYGADDQSEEDEDEEADLKLMRARQQQNSLLSNGSRRSSLTSDLSVSHQNGSAGSSNQHGTSKRMRSLVGLANLGNTCFLNSTLQCLMSTPGLLEYFSTGKFESDINTKAARTKGSLARAFGALATRMATLPDHSIERPSAVKSAVSIIDSKFLGYGQHDSHEFTRVLLSALHDDVNRVRIKPAYEEIKDAPHDSNEVKANRWWKNYTDRNSSIVTDCFSGQIQSTLVCQSCQSQSEAFDPFMDLSLPIPKARGSSSGFSSALSRLSLFSSSSSSSSSAVSRCTMNDCFNEFLKEELLSGQEQVYCRTCKTHRNQTKKFTIYRWPTILVLHLKRFSYGTYSRSKLNTDVEFQMELDCTNMQSTNRKEPPAIYDLYAVSNHMGSTGGGHYTAHCKVSDNPTAVWFTFNDSSVHAISSGQVRGPSAYVLFYRRRV